MGAAEESRIADLLKQVRSAQIGLGWSVQDLLDHSSLTIDRSSLSRRLNGVTETSVHELEALAEAIRKARPEFRLQFPKERAA